MSKKSGLVSTKGTGDFASGGAFTKLSTMGNDVCDGKVYKIVGISVAKADGRPWGFETDGDITIPFNAFYNSQVEGHHNTTVGQYITGMKTSDDVRKALNAGRSLENLTFSFASSKIKMVNNKQRYDISSYPMFDTFPKDDYGNPSTAMRLQEDDMKTDDARRGLFRKLYEGKPKEGHGHPILAFDYVLDIQGEAPKNTPDELKEIKAQEKAAA